MASPKLIQGVKSCFQINYISWILDQGESSRKYFFSLRLHQLVVGLRTRSTLLSLSQTNTQIRCCAVGSVPQLSTVPLLHTQLLMSDYLMSYFLSGNLFSLIPSGGTVSCCVARPCDGSCTLCHHHFIHPSWGSKHCNSIQYFIL